MAQMTGHAKLSLIARLAFVPQLLILVLQQLQPIGQLLLLLPVPLLELKRDDCS